MHKVPFVRKAVLATVLAHRRDDDPVLELHIAEPDRTKKLRTHLICRVFYLCGRSCRPSGQMGAIEVHPPSGSTLLDDAPLGLSEFELQPYFGIWQKPERRFTHFGVGTPYSGSSWVLVCPSELAAAMYIEIDAADNGRTSADYEARKLTLPDAFHEARSQPLPILHSTGMIYRRVGGVAVFDIIGSRF